jgi:aminopeptidase N
LFSHYYATEIPYGHGQAFPGLIHLSWYTFQSVDESGFDEVFRAHEMAHQWWGIGVEPADYRDVWLSEGFSDFAGLWYMQRILKDNQKFFRQLEEWRKAIRARRDNAPPIALGGRTGEEDPGDYQTIVYEKGAWVLQMLRNLMLDLRTMNEDAFTATMQDFYRQYRGHRATTRDFQRVVEQHAGGRMVWFFNEWVNGTAIPTYVISWKTEPTADQRYILHLRIRQENVPPDFAMPVPLLIEFADSSHALIRVSVRGPLTERDLRLPAEPTRLELNTLSSVLAEVKTEGWH